MYDDHYGFSGRPFQLTPDPKFWFDTTSHRKAMSYLGYGLSQGEGFIVITGDVGTGKTTLVGHLMEKLDRELLHVVKIASTQIEPEDLLRIVAVGLGEEIGGASKAELLATIERGLHAVARSGRRTLLIVDEAQALPVAALEELRMLSNLSAGGHALLQIFLLGQPEFRERLQGSDRLEQLRQRVIALHHLDPMGADEVEPYMAHRLNLVGWNGRPQFTDDAFDALYAGSGGIPRLLNQLAGRVLLFGAIEGLETINGRAVEAVVADIRQDTPQPHALSVPPVLREVAPAPIAVVEAAPAPQSEPIAATVPEPVAVAAPEPQPEPAAVAEPLAPKPALVQTAPEPVVAEVPPVIDPALADRVAALEARLEDQDETLRRILTLMVDWVETGHAPASLRGAA